jgi:PilZ domain
VGRRDRERMPAIVPVRIWGTTREGKTFTEHVCTVDISGTGARLGGVRAFLHIGDSLGLQYRNRQARFRVVWVGSRSTPTGTQVGIECLEPHKNVWQVTLPADSPDFYEIVEARPRRYQRPARERRIDTRFPISGKAYVSSLYGGSGVWAKLGDISANGCYLELGHPFGVSRNVSLLIKVPHAEIEAVGVVRVSYPGTAMGVEFTMLKADDRRRLNELINYLQEVETALTLIGPES